MKLMTLALISFLALPSWSQEASAPTDNPEATDGFTVPQPIVDAAFSRMAQLADKGRPMMVRDLVQGEWLYGGRFILPKKLNLDLPAVHLPGGLSFDLASTPIEFSAGVA
jgi:hypothetical protein